MIDNYSESRPFLSICITSYNRVDELRRCLESIDSHYVELIEIVVSEDCSPKKNEIREVVEKFRQANEYSVLFNSNEVNLGYDRNLGRLIELANGRYVLFISDDDSFIAGALDKTIEKLLHKECALAFSPFFVSSTRELKRRFVGSFGISPNVKNLSKYIYCSILFSGLVFERSKILCFDAARFKNLIYFQVYLFASVLHKYGGCYFDIPLVNCIGDGENAFGISSSSVKNDLLANRKSLYSSLEFHKLLIQVIDIFDKENETNISKEFSKDYSLRSYAGMAKARKASRIELVKYWKTLNSLDMKLTPIARIYYFFLYVFGTKICNCGIYLPKKALLRIREVRR